MDDNKDIVRQATDIVDLAGSYLSLRRQGRGYVALCPWHDDSRPSLQINPERQSFKCWVCDIGGDVFSFVMKMDGLEFREAMEMLADRAGISLAPNPNAPRIEPGSPGDKKTLYAAMAWAVAAYHRCLQVSPAAAPARRYLADRSITDESVERFGIGFAPTDWDWLLRQAEGAGFSPAVLERVNLIAPRKSGPGHYDQFRGRLLFPIRDVRSRPVAIGGRVLPELVAAEQRPDYKPAKYVNSAETPIYSKSHELYALDLARDRAQQRDQLIVVEGYTDVIAAHQAGVTNVVAACGTAVGEGHLKLIRRYTDRVVLVLDGDEAGRRRASELLELFIASPIDLKILTLPNGLDPCDFISSHGSDEFVALVDTAPDALEHKLMSVSERMPTAVENTHDAASAVEEVLGTLAKTRVAVGEANSSMVLREQSVLGRLSRRFRLPEEGLRQRLNDLRKGSPAVAPKASPAGDMPALPPAKTLSAWEREAIELLLVSSEIALELTATLDEADFLSAAGRAVFVLCREQAEQGDASFERLMLAAASERMKGLLVELDERGRDRATSDVRRRINDLLSARRRRHEDARHGEQLAALEQGNLAETAADEAVIALFADRKRRETGPLSTDG
ncbi:DNA primase [Botrimarina hoheduenensis]|uniref:DNA primase n=1 Tax=Botrimarina hoheduenensis TaxID=2528000 RepID=A0A5C5WF70_9BACT|nr:DNA primase [Botrimarina hoheduenensis]TWT48739.1 DNA primase [Botrimarina hoheduenensis]